jgi:uncharacterized protein YbjT (DUF2867 family)
MGAGYSVRALTRKPDGDAAKALAAAGAEVVQGDLSDADSVTSALNGVWGAFSLQNTWEAGVEEEERQGKQFAELAKNAGVQHLVYSSVGSANRSTGEPHFDNKARVELTIAGLNLPSYTILRPVFFMENMKTFFAPDENGNIYIALDPATRLQMVAVADIAKFGLVAFQQAAELNGKAIDFAGDELTIPEAAAAISAASGKTVQHVKANIEDVRAYSADMAAMFEWFDSSGYNADIGSQESKYGVKPTSFQTWAQAAY